MKIDFCIIGPQRTGSSFLDKVLRSHKDVQLPLHVKETFFFDQKFDSGIKYYESTFFSEKLESTKGEVSPTYFNSDNAIKNLYKYSPSLQIIIILRNPVERSISLFKHHLTKGRVSKQFKKAVLQEPGIIDSSKYKKYVTNWINVFGEENVHIMLYDDLTNFQLFMDNLCGILKVEKINVTKFNKPYGAITYPKVKVVAKIFAKTATMLRSYNLHSIAEFGKKIGLKKLFQGGKDISEIDQKFVSSLRNGFLEDINFVEELIGKDLSHWKRNNL